MQKQQGCSTLAGSITDWTQNSGALYTSGDTVLFEGLEEVARRFQVAVALLHFGATQANRFGPVSITLTAAEGSRFASLLGDATIIPIHYEGWTHLTDGRDEIEQAFLADGREKQLRFLPLGQPVSIDM